MNDLDTLRPEVRSALGAMVRADVCRDSVPTDAFDIIRAELLRLAGECAMIPRAQLLANLAAANERAEKAEAELAIAQNTIDAQQDTMGALKRKLAIAEAELEALKARIADGWLCGVSNDKCSGNFDAAIYCLPSRFRGMRVRLVVEE